MKRVLLLATVLLAPAGVAHAAPVRMVVRDVPLHGGRVLSGTTPAFNLVGLHWQGSGTPWFRTRARTGRWSAWEAADDDWGRSGAWRKGNPVWTGPADAIQVRTRGRVTRVREYLLWSPPVSVPERRLQIAGAPAIISRAGWQADESIRRAPPRYAPVLKLAIVHHTATTNSYSCANSASIVRGIEVYHVKANGWDDIGYNFLVDACGQIFEGRYGGIDRNVIGAHSAGFNTGTSGVALIGSYQNATPTQAQQSALVKLLAWRLDIAHVDPLSTVSYVSGGNPKYPAGTTVSLRAVSGHRDTYPTECPGDGVYRLLPAIAKRVSQTGAPKLYSPVVTGEVGGPVRFTARLSASLPWTVTISDVTGAEAATWSDIGTSVDWTWDSQDAIPGAAYRWTISSPAGFRPATGTLGGQLAALAVAGLKVSPPLISGQTLPTATVSYSLSVPATVSVDLLDADGALVETIDSGPKPTGAQSALFDPSDVPDGNYVIRVGAQDALGRQARAAVPVAVSRTLSAFAADTKLVSPNGDGRRDAVTFRFMLLQPSAVTLALVSAEAEFSVFSGELMPGRQTVVFSGPAVDGSPVPDGTYQATLTAGAVSETLPLTIDDTPPNVSLVSVKPLTLRVAERVTVIAVVNGRTIRASRKPGVFVLARKETIRSLRVVVRDAAGNQSAPVTYRRRR